MDTYYVESDTGCPVCGASFVRRWPAPIEKGFIMAKLWIGTILNFILLGPGYLLFTKRKVLGAFLTIGAFLATYVEQALLPGGAAYAGTGTDETAYQVMFVAIFCIAIGCAVDGHQEIKKALQE